MAAQQQRFERVYPVNVDVLYAAFQSAVANGKFKKVVADDFTKTIVFRTSPTPLAWGHHWQGQVTGTPEGSRLVLTAGSSTSNVLASSGTKQASQSSAKLFAEVSRRAAAAGVDGNPPGTGV